MLAPHSGLLESNRTAWLSSYELGAKQGRTHFPNSSFCRHGVVPLGDILLQLAKDHEAAVDRPLRTSRLFFLNQKDILINDIIGECTRVVDILYRGLGDTVVESKADIDELVRTRYESKSSKYLLLETSHLSLANITSYDLARLGCRCVLHQASGNVIQSLRDIVLGISSHKHNTIERLALEE